MLSQQAAVTESLAALTGHTVLVGLTWGSRDQHYPQFNSLRRSGRCWKTSPTTNRTLQSERRAPIDHSLTRHRCCCRRSGRPSLPPPCRSCLHKRRETTNQIPVHFNFLVRPRPVTHFSGGCRSFPAAHILLGEVGSQTIHLAPPPPPLTSSSLLPVNGLEAATTR